MIHTTFVRSADREQVLADVMPASRARDTVLISAGALLVALLAQINIPIAGSPVPVSGQTLAVVVVGASLGASRGAASLALYAALGLFLPFYADGASGSHVIFGSTGGYIIGFIFAAWLVGRAAEHGADRRPVQAALAYAAGQLAVFAVGVPWLKVAAAMSWGDAVHYGFTVFLLGGAIKAVLGAIVTPSAWRLVHRLDAGR